MITCYIIKFTIILCEAILPDAEKMSPGNVSALVIGLVLWAASLSLLIVTIVTIFRKNKNGKFDGKYLCTLMLIFIQELSVLYFGY